MRHSGSVFAAAALLGATTAAWQNKDFKKWTDKDAHLIMTDSPWAKQMPMPASGRPDVMVIEPGSNGAPPPSATLGNPASPVTGTNVTNPNSPGNSGPASTNGSHTPPTARSPSGMAISPGAPTPYSPLTIIWASATPVRLAVLKLRSGGTLPDDDRIARARKPAQNYLILVRGVEEPDAGSDPSELAKNAFLKVKDKAPLAAYESGYWSGPQVYFFRFRKASLPIEVSAREVEFRMTMGQMEIKKKFDLKDMQFEGQLAL